MKQKYYLALDRNEYDLILNSLNDLRNSLIEKGKYTDGVDDVIVKIVGAKTKKFKVIYMEV